VNVDAVQQRTADLAEILLDCPGVQRHSWSCLPKSRTAGFMAETSMNGWKRSVMLERAMVTEPSSSGWRAFQQSWEFRELVQEQHSVVARLTSPGRACPRLRQSGRHRKSCDAERGRAVRARPCCCPTDRRRCGLGGLNGLWESERRQNASQPPGSMVLPEPGGDQQHVVRTRGGHFERALGMVCREHRGNPARRQAGFATGAIGAAA